MTRVLTPWRVSSSAEEFTEKLQGNLALKNPDFKDAIKASLRHDANLPRCSLQKEMYNSNI